MLDSITIKEVKVNLGAWCKNLRKHEGLSQEELADKLALSRVTIHNLEKGANFTIDTLLKVIRHFGELENLNNYVKENTHTYQSLY